MKKKISLIFAFLVLLVQGVALAQAKNPIIFADVPDMSMIRVGNNYYMSSTTMHMNPGVPIMKSTDLVNWKLINYAHESLADMPELNLTDGKNAYSKGTWASSLRFHNGMYYVTTFSYTTGETYIFKTPDIDKGNWQRVSFKPAYHDNSLFFDDDGKVYLIYGADRLKIVELNKDLTGINKSVPERVLIENASAPTGKEVGLAAEGSQLFKVNGKYYLFNICAPRGEMRTVLIHRADSINGPWEGKVAFQDRGIAQGGLIDTPDGRWYSYLFQDYGSVGRIPYLVPVKWENGWPVLGVNGKAPVTLDLPASTGLISNLVASDEFDREEGQAALPLVWQWNHNPDNKLWSVQERKGYLRLKTARIDNSFEQVRNILTQRTIGPVCTGSTLLDVSQMKEGDFAGLTAFQKKFGQVGVKVENGQKFIVMVNAASSSGKPIEVQQFSLTQDYVYLRIDCDFTNKKDEAKFAYSLDGNAWNPIGNILRMTYDIPHFMGYRFGLFNYATKNTGGYVDFDFFHITDTIIPLPIKLTQTLYSENFESNFGFTGDQEVTFAPSTKAGTWKGKVNLETDGDVNMRLRYGWSSTKLSLKTTDAAVTIPNINVAGYTGLSLSIDMVIPGAATVPFIEASVDGGASWVTLPTVDDGSWGVQTQSIFLPAATSTISLRINPPAAGDDQVFDNFIITGTAVATGINQLSDNSIQVYPNPATDKISLLNCINGFIKIYDLQGKLSLSTKIESSIDISILNSGVYLVQINNLKSITYIKLIKK